MRRLVAIATALLASTALPTQAAAIPVIGPRCSFLADPTENTSDVASFVVTGGPVYVGEPGTTSVTVTCWVLTDGSRAASVSATRQGSVGWVVGRTSVGTFTGPVVTFCTEITWTGGSTGSATDCPDVS